MIRRNTFDPGLALAAWHLGVAGTLPAQPANADLHVLPVQGNVYMLVGAGGNITVQAGKEGVLLVDTGLAQNADRVLAEVRKISDRPIRYIINTQREDRTSRQNHRRR